MGLRGVLTKLCIAFTFPVLAIEIALFIILFGDPIGDDLGDC
jgi:hypothetical protein